MLVTVWLVSCIASDIVLLNEVENSTSNTYDSASLRKLITSIQSFKKAVYEHVRRQMVPLTAEQRSNLRHKIWEKKINLANIRVTMAHAPSMDMNGMMKLVGLLTVEVVCMLNILCTLVSNEEHSHEAEHTPQNDILPGNSQNK